VIGATSSVPKYRSCRLGKAAGDRAGLRIVDCGSKERENFRERRPKALTEKAVVRVKKAAFVCPLAADDEPLVHQGTTASGIEIHLVRIDLAAPDLGGEEKRFQRSLGSALSLD
jgi:hypothetical protein